MQNETLSEFQRLLEIIAKLRNPNGGCPWDLEQTHQSLKPYLIEESYEVVDAIDSNSPSLSEELGDVLLQVALHSQIACEAGTFEMLTVIKQLNDKLVRRHPHVFGETKVENSTEVLKNWEQIKQTERAEKKGALSGIPKALPSLQRAQRLGEKAGRLGFDWNTAEEVKSKVKEELDEFLEAGKNTKEEEFGDLLFSLAQWGRKEGLQCEEALRSCCNKFSQRFSYIENNAPKPIKEMSRAELEALWEASKKLEEANP